jgi:hypothetical protein
MQASMSQLAKTVLQTTRLTELRQESQSTSQRAVADSLDALARSRDLLAHTSAMVHG